MLVFYLFAGLLIWQALVSLLGGVRYLSYIRRELSRETPDFTPFATIIAPCRGLDQGLRENLSALFRQDYPRYELIFVTDSDADPSLEVIEDVLREFNGAGRIAARVLVAGPATESGQKVHNLRAAVAAASPESRVLVFVDSDARPRPAWLRSLVAPLGNDGTGAATGYRWFIPVRGGLASHLRAVWNASIASALGERGERNFCWGGATAIRRETFERIGMPEKWRGAVSDDFALMRALRAEGLPIHFVPACLTASHDDCGFRELLEFTTRQLKITRVYARPFWLIVLFSNLLFVLVFFGGLALVIVRAALGLPFAPALALLLALYVLGTAKAYLRWRAVGLALAAYRAELRRGLAGHLLLWPVTSALYLYNALAALVSRRIEWRGLAYELKSPTETVIIAPVHRRSLGETGKS
ncbi:MAG TPA: glycosyltransferase [Pyrinomonadaceae bacterium]|jgi:cellulose synthase/poly-beta-1,6-N-acetylglucosamine synthase-like glycosyltransferase